MLTQEEVAEIWKIRVQLTRDIKEIKLYDSMVNIVNNSIDDAKRSSDKEEYLEKVLDGLHNGIMAVVNPLWDEEAELEDIALERLAVSLGWLVDDTLSSKAKTTKEDVNEDDRWAFNVTCIKHGEFSVQAKAHLEGVGCPVCDGDKGVEVFYDKENDRTRTRWAFGNGKEINAKDIDYELANHVKFVLKNMKA